MNTFISHINDCVIHSQIGVRKVDKLLLVKLNKKVNELIMLECARSPHVAIFANELFNKTL